MRCVSSVILTAALVLLTFGCERRQTYDGPRVDSFSGRVVKDGNPVSFPPDETVQLKLIHDKAKSFGIPIATDGSFKIGWMPTGKYSVMLIRERKGTGGKTMPSMYNVPNGFEIVDGKTEYDVELGKEWKP